MSKHGDDGKFGRWLKLIARISARPGKTGVELAQELGCSTRTIYRDVKELERAGFPVYRDDGYRFASDLFLPAMNFTPRELLALLLGMRFLERQSQEPLRAAARSTLEKVLRVASERGRPVLDSLDDRVGFADPPTHADSRLIEEISGALVRSRQLEIGYRSVERTRPLTRRIDPWGLYHYAGAWYFRGFDHHHAEPRNYRLSRITSLEVLPDKVSRVADFSPDEAIFHKWDLGGAEPVAVTLEVTDKLGRWLAENPPHPSQQLDGSCAAYRVRAPLAMIGWLMSLDGARVLNPHELREAVAARAARIHSIHVC